MLKRIVSFAFVCLVLLGISLFAEEDVAKINAKFGDFYMMGVHYHTLKDSSNANEYETVAKELADKVNKALPGQKWIVMKADRGEVDASYILVVLFDSVERRDYYYPEGEMSETFQKMLDDLNIQPLFDKMLELVDWKFGADLAVVK